MRIRLHPFGSQRLRALPARRNDQAGQLTDTNLVVRSFAAGVSGGTAASMVEVVRAAASDADAGGS